MPVINTTEDMLRLLDENEQFLAAARHKILTDELIRLPQRFDEYAAATDKKFEALLEQARATNSRLDAMESRQDTMDGRLNNMDSRLDTMDGRLDNIESDGGTSSAT